MRSSRAAASVGLLCAPRESNGSFRSGISPVLALLKAVRRSSAIGTLSVIPIGASSSTCVAFSIARSPAAGSVDASSGAIVAIAATRPKCRTPIVNVPLRVRPDSTSSAAFERVGTASPSPRPHRASAHIAIGTLADGSNASATRPAASSPAPAAAFRGSARAANAASGSTLTISAPSIGVYCQTMITSNTPRKSAPTSAPKTRPRQTFAGTVRRSDGRQPSAAVGSSSRRQAATSPAAATGACAIKIARQSKSCVRTPPSAGPSAAPNVPASVQTFTAISDSAPASSSPAPAPCTQRAAIKNHSACADAHAIVAARKSSEPAANTSRARNRCTKNTSASAVSATAALYAVTIHDTPVIDVSKREYSCGSARTTIDESANAIATSAATSNCWGLTPKGSDPGLSVLRRALFGDCVEPFAEIIDIAREIIQPRQLRQGFEPEDALEHRRRAVLDRPAGAVVAPSLGDQPALDQARNRRVGRDATDPRDLRPRHRPEVRDDRQRLQSRLRDPALHRTFEQPPARHRGVARRAESPAAGHLLEDDAAAPLAVALRQQSQSHLDSLAVVVRGRDELFQWQRRAGNDEQRLQRARQLVERIGGD